MWPSSQRVVIIRAACRRVFDCGIQQRTCTCLRIKAAPPQRRAHLSVWHNFSTATETRSTSPSLLTAVSADASKVQTRENENSRKRKPHGISSLPGAERNWEQHLCSTWTSICGLSEKVISWTRSHYGKVFIARMGAIECFFGWWLCTPLWVMYMYYAERNELFRVHHITENCLIAVQFSHTAKITHQRVGAYILQVPKTSHSM